MISFFKRQLLNSRLLQIFNIEVDDFIKFYWSQSLSFFVLIFDMYFVLRYANQPLLESYGFRQTQTALSSYWMIHDGWQLAYQTPVGGYPWSMPYEFPIYQSIAALISWLGNFNLDMVGRLLSFFFLLACAWPALQIARRLNLRSEVAWIFCALFWSSPIYLFWGRSFMIETAALFFTLAAIPYSLDLQDDKPHWSSIFYFVIFITLGMLQKVTTAAPAVVIMGILLVVSHLENPGLKMSQMRKLTRITIAFFVPLFIAFFWSKYTEFVRTDNPLGSNLASTLTRWLFGTLAQRLDLSVLKKIFWERSIVNNATGFMGVALIIASLIFGNRRVKRMVTVCLILFAFPILIFTNLHWVHDYYPASCVVYLIGALVISITAWEPIKFGRYAIVPALTLILVISNFYHFEAAYSRMVLASFDVSSSPVLATCDVIRRYTPLNSGIVVFGYDFSSEIAFYSERKSFTVPNWFKDFNRVWDTPASFLGDKELGAIIFCKSDKSISLDKIMQRPDVKSNPNIYEVKDFYVWLPNAKSIILPDGNLPILPVKTN